MKQLIKNLSLPLIDYGIKSTRLIALSGERNFYKYIHLPLDYAGWERHQKNETSKNLIERINKSNDKSTYHTISPLCKRLISLALTESLKDLGDACIFFYEKMRYYPIVMQSQEAIEFFNILYTHYKEFDSKNHKQRSIEFENKLNQLSNIELQDAFKPVELGRYKIKVKFQKEAAELFKKIYLAHKQNNIPRCQKLISTYLIKFAGHQENNREQVENLIDAFSSRDSDFRNELNDSMAIMIYFEVLAGITENNLKKTIQAVRKYALIFQGNPDIRHYLEIDALEKKLYRIIEEKNLWESLSESRDE
jgi:hypothetical protein